MIPYGKQSINEADIEAVVEILRSDRITQGPAVEHFEEELAGYAGAGHAVVVNSGTSALHLACRVLDLGPGDYLWTSPLTYVASANCARYCGAQVRFVDINPATGNLSISALSSALEQARRDGDLPKIVVPVHFAGFPCDMEAIHALAREYDFRIVEDASHALGAHDVSGAVGHCKYSDATVFSFHPVKSITTGEGGAVLTNNSALAGRLARLRSHGITREPAFMSGQSEGPWYYEQIELGYNYRMTDIQAALGRAQLVRLDDWIDRRNILADRYDRLLTDMPVITPSRPSTGRSAFHLYVIRIDTAATTHSRAEIFGQLIAAGIGVNVHYIPVHLHPYYRALGFSPGMYPFAEEYYQAAITLPLFPGLSDTEQDHIVASLTRSLGR